LLYAFGEILLVVIGILIALQVNTWNENRIIRDEIKLNLENLSGALKKDHDLLTQIENNNEFRYKSLKQLLKLIEIDTGETDTTLRTLNSQVIWNSVIPDTFNVDFNVETFKWINRPRTMIIHYDAMEELKSTGLYSRLKNQKLKNMISDYYTDLEWVFGNDLESNNDDLQDLNNYVRDHYNLRLSDIGTLNDPIEFIKNDAALIVRLRSVINGATWRLRGAKQGKTTAEVLIKEIESEVSEY
jgi:hypothetical protein